MSKIVYKISKWYLNKPVILRKNFAREWLLEHSQQNITIITSTSAWKYFEDCCSIVPKNLILNPSLEIVELDKIAETIDTKWIVGIGAGRIMDTSKYLAWKCKSKKISLCLIPSITSTTSWLNMAIAVRNQNILTMPASYHAKITIFDPEYISSAPKPLNTGGLADLAASASAMSDWILANKKNGENISKYALKEYKYFLDRLLKSKSKLVSYNMDSVKYIYETFLDALSLCGASFSGRPMEGSEHFLYYYLDEIDERKWNHGQIISFTCLLCLKLYGDDAYYDPELLKEYFREIGIDFRPKTLGLNSESLYSLIMGMKDFVNKRNLYYTIWNDPERYIEPKKIEEILQWIEK